MAMLGSRNLRLLRDLKLSAMAIQRSSYVDVTMKWKKDYYFDSVDILTKSRDLRPLIALKNIIAAAGHPTIGIPISDVSKLGRQLEISGRVAAFMRRFPAVFEEFTGPHYNLPWFRLTAESLALHYRENSIYEARKLEMVERLRRVVLMSKEKMLPFSIVQGLLWFLGLPEDFLKNEDEISTNEYLKIIELGDGDKWLRAEFKPGENLLSVLQRNYIKQFGGCPISVSFPLFPSKGLRLKQKIETWLEEFQKLPYISPYEDFSRLDPSSDVSEKRVAGILHELLSLFVDNSAERRRLLCLRRHLGLPQKFHKVPERHPHVFYLLLKQKTCTVVLKEAYFAGSATEIEKHPMLEVRMKYVQLMNKSELILRSRRSRRSVPEVEEEDICV